MGTQCLFASLAKKQFSRFLCSVVTMPSLFEKIGKATKDLFNEDYSLKNQLKISQKASNGTSLQATATTNGAGLKSELKTTIKASDVVSVETKVDCCNKVSFKIDYT